MSVWGVQGDEVWYSGWRVENYLSCITALVGPQDLEVKRLFNVQFQPLINRQMQDMKISPPPLLLPVFRLTRHSVSVSKLRLRLTLTTLDHSKPKVLPNSRGPCRPPPLPYSHPSLPSFFSIIPPSFFSNPLFALPWPLPGSLIIWWNQYTVRLDRCDPARPQVSLQWWEGRGVREGCKGMMITARTVTLDRP